MISPSPGWDTPGTSNAASPAGQLSIATPELVSIEFPLAGIGSRFVAVLLDYLILGASAILLGLLFAFIVFGLASGSSHSGLNKNPSMSEKWIIAIALLIPFLFMWGYFTLFEAFWHGQTPGKRIMKLRVIQETGRPISLFESMARNLLRIIDYLPFLYIVGIVTMFITRRQQRVGDLLAGTLVVHEQVAEVAFDVPTGSRTFTAATFQQTIVPPPPRISSLPADAVARLGLPDLHAVESYLARRLDVPVEVRAHLAQSFSDSMARKMIFPIPDGMSRETFLEELAFALRGQRR